jgi:polyferredoxin
MQRQKHYLRLTLLISILFGIILPLVLGVKDPTYIAIYFSSVWVLYIVIRWIAFLIRPELKIKVLRHKNPTIVRFELSDPQRRGGEAD